VDQSIYSFTLTLLSTGAGELGFRPTQVGGTSLTFVDPVATATATPWCLAAPARFSLGVNGLAPVSVIVLDDGTPNISAEHLAADISYAINQIVALKDLIRVTIGSDNRVLLEAIDPNVVRMITVSISDPEDMAVTELGIGTSAVAGVWMTAEQEIWSTFGRLSGDANLTIDLTMAAGGVVNGSLLVTAESTRADTEAGVVANTSIADLVADINAALLAEPGLAGKILASSSGQRIVLQSIDAAVRSFTVTAAAGDPAVTELGFAASQSANAVLSLSANRAAPWYIGLSADASFEITITDGTSQAPLTRSTSPGRLLRTTAPSSRSSPT